MTDQLGVTVTGAEMYRELVQLVRSVDILTVEVKSRAAETAVTVDQLVAADADKEARIRQLERRLYAGLGVVGLLAPAATAFITARLTGA